MKKIYITIILSDEEPKINSIKNGKIIYAHVLTPPKEKPIAEHLGGIIRIMCDTFLSII